MSGTISVVVPTYDRYEQIQPLLKMFVAQTLQPLEVIIIDGSPPDDGRTEQIVTDCRKGDLPFKLRYFRSDPGIARQRNVGIDHARGEFIACVDDDIRLAPDYFEQIVSVFLKDRAGTVGGVCGYVDNHHHDQESLARWRWYRRLRLFTTYEPGRYDRSSGYPINTYLDPSFQGLKEVDFLSGGYTVWRREVFDSGLRFSLFFDGAGPLEDVHLALQAARWWKLLKLGSAHCRHLHAPSGRPSRWKAGYRSVVNYWFVYQDIVRDRRLINSLRFWYVQIVWILMLLIRGFRDLDIGSFVKIGGRLQGAIAALRIRVT